MSNRFDGHNFPPYEYRPYPKQVIKKDGKIHIVKDEDEHAEFDKNEAKLPDPKKAAETAPVDDKAKLLARAEELGISIPKTWGVKKIAAAIADKEAESEEEEVA